MMDPERWRQIDAVLQLVLERPPADRARFLDETCSGDEHLRREVLSLLSSEQALSIMDRPAFERAAGLLSTHIPELVTGELIGHYRIISFLGAGGMGEVYLAADTTLHRRVAIKLLPYGNHLYGKQLYRFQQEARAASALNHPNIITIYETGQIDGQHFIVSELVEGETLRQLLDRKRASISKALDISTQVASALSMAHEAGIVHRDIKPENIMVRSDGYVKVLDFGLAKLIGPQEQDGLDSLEEEAVTTPGLLMGTVKYMSPEQARGLDVDSRSDIFSLAVVMYEMLTGRSPFEGETNSDLIASLLKDEPPPLRDYLSNAPQQVQRIITRALSKDKQERYQSLADMLDDLKQSTQELQLESQGSQQVKSSAVTASTRDTAPARTSPSVERMFVYIKAHKARVVAIALVIALLSIISWLDLSKRKSGEPFQNLEVSVITGTENSWLAAISPDGKYIAYFSSVADKSEFWVRDNASDSRSQIVPPTKASYKGLIFSPDSKYIYFVRSDENSSSSAFYRIAVLGGEPEKILTGIDSPPCLSPDGKQFAFRRDMGKGETALVIANSGDAGERILATRKAPESFYNGEPSWSPDGKVIACPVWSSNSDSESGGTYMNVVGISVDGGAQRALTSEKWTQVHQAVWLPNGSGLVMSVVDQGWKPPQLWFLSYPECTPRRITNDLNGYSRVSMTADSRTILTAQYEDLSHIFVAPNGDASQAKQITYTRFDDFKGLSCAPDGRIVVPSSRSGNRDVWIMNADGTSAKQLTSDKGVNPWVAVSRDGKYVVLCSNRTGTFHIWRMDIDGSNVKQLTNRPGEVSPDCSPNGWVVYAFGGKIWKVPIDGGEPVRLTDKPSAFPRVSPDGKWLACWYQPESNAPRKVAILPFDGNGQSRILDIPGNPILRWTPDAQALTYVVTKDNVSNIWSQPLDGSPPRQLTYFNSLGIKGYDWSRDGNLVCSRGFTATDVVLISDLR